MFLLEHGAHVNGGDGVECLLFQLISHREEVQALIPHVLARGANPDPRDNRLHTPLHRTVRDGNIRSTRRLIEAGSELEARTERGLTPLHYAVIGGRREIVPLVLEHGAQVETADQHGDRPLHSAAASAAQAGDFFHILKLPLTNGRADIAAANYFGQTALHCAIQGAGYGGG
jgi:ankyrin repeat protein